MTEYRDVVHQIVIAMAPGTVPPEWVPAPPPAVRLIEDLGYDSLRLMELTVALENAFNVGPYRPEELSGVRTVGAVIDLVSGSLPGGSQ